MLDITYEGHVANPGVDAKKANGPRASFVILGALLCLFRGALALLALLQHIEFGTRAFLSGHGGTFMLLAFGLPPVALGVLAIRAGRA